MTEIPMGPELLSPGQSRLATVEQLLDFDFDIPAFQRPYDWSDKQVSELIDDLSDAQRKNVHLFLGLVVVCPQPNGRFAIVDGQQRLTTLMLAVGALGGTEKILRSKDGGVSSLWISPRHADIGFAKALVSTNGETEQTLSQRRLKQAFSKLCDQESLKLATLLGAQLIVYVAPSLAGATGLFERINLRGKEVSQFDLVKNKLIEWAAIERDTAVRAEIEDFITARYDTLYRRLDPSSKAEPFDSDKLLRVHWILFTQKQFKSSDRVLTEVNSAIDETYSSGKSIAGWIENYLDSLVRVAETWVAVERPYEATPPSWALPLKRALLDFARLGRDGELQPLIVAAILRWQADATDLVRFCEITSFRSALAKKNSNHGRSYKWRVARQLYQGTWSDALKEPISQAADAVHQLFWANTPYWSKNEALEFGEDLTLEQFAAEVFPDNALDSTRFHKDYRHLIHYFFWKYGVYLQHSEEWADFTRMDISPFQDSVWFGTEERFKGWDIEHIYPQTPADRNTREGRAHLKVMTQWVDHLGNLTVLPVADNRGMQNLPFVEKLAWLRAQKKVSFNELLVTPDYRGNLLNKPHWGINNCRRRIAEIRTAAAALWGFNAVRKLGVGLYDNRLESYQEDLEEESSDIADDSAEIVAA
ncbi:DUF262 domain-containing protein [Paraburkholderia bannensis]|uniref:DUF262 domain-containing protein n=1 Tax=Paraburkholderia bannensis TaxID=765414 RepID=UPI002AC36C14|nr:DUF262 domain-containing HNH endonuclease family protein [Paraburkholderia bannensis]